MSETRLSRLEIWSDTAAAGGQRVAFVPPGDYLEGVIETWELGAQHTLSVPLRRESTAWAHIRHGAVLRAINTDGSWDEWRIRPRIGDGRSASGELRAQLVCQAPWYDLGRAGIVSRLEADGQVNHGFWLYGLTASDLIDFVLANSGAPAYFTAGTIELTDRIDVEFDWDNPLSALRKIERAVREKTGEGELEFERDGTSGYLIHLRGQIAEGQGEAVLRYSRNNLAISRELDDSDQATRVYPRGAEVDGLHHDMAEAAWVIANVVGNDIELDTAAGRPIGFDGQHVDMWIERAGSVVRRQITFSVEATQTLTVTNSAGFIAGDLVHVRLDALGTRLTYLEHPTAILPPPSGGYGVIARVLERTDLPATDNLLSNAFLSDWLAGLPVDWTAVGSPTIAEESSTLFRRLGARSAHVTADAADEGIQSDLVPIAPTDARPFFTAQISLHVVSGKVRFELVTDDGTIYPSPDDTVAVTSETGWVDALAIAGVDLNEVNATGARLRVLAHQGPAEWYLDAGMLTQTAAGSEAWFEGRSSNALWLSANEKLAEDFEPRVNFDIDAVDLYRLDPEAYPFDAIIRGGHVTAIDTDLGLNFGTRVVKEIRDRVSAGVVQVELSNLRRDLSGLLGPGVEPRRVPESLPRRPVPAASPVLEQDLGGELFLLPNRNAHARSVRYVVRTDTEPTLTEVRSGTVTTASRLHVHTFSGVLTERAYVGVLPYAQANGTGEEGALLVVPHAFQQGPAGDPGSEGPPGADGTTGPRIVRMWSFGGIIATDVQIQLDHSEGLGGTLAVWVNRLSTDTPDPSGPPDGTVVFGSSPFFADDTTVFQLTGGGTANLLSAIPIRPNEPKQISAQFTDTLGRSTEQVSLTLVGFMDIQDQFGVLTRDADTGLLALRLVTNPNVDERAISIRNLVVGSFDNLIEDDSFEAAGKFVADGLTASVAFDRAGWVHRVSSGGTWEVTTTDPFVGTYAARYLRAGQIGTAILGTGGGSGPTAISAKPGQEHYFQARPRMSGAGTGGQARIEILYLDATGGVLAQALSDTINLTFSYQLIGLFSAPAPAGTAAVQCNLLVLDAGTIGAVLWDECFAHLKVDGKLIVNGSILADHISANAVVAGKIAAKAAIFENLNIGSFINMIPDPGFESGDLAFSDWRDAAPTSGGTWLIQGGNPRSGSFALQFTRAGQTGIARLRHAQSGMACEPGERYLLRGWFRGTGSGSGTSAGAQIVFRDAGAGIITDPDHIDVCPVGTYVLRTLESTAPAGAVRVDFEAVVLNNGTTTSIRIDDFFAQKKTPSELIVDGAILAQHITATLTLEVGQLIQSTSYVAGSAGWRINAAGSAEFNNVTIRGTLDGVTGTFSGNLSAAGGTFAGNLSAAGGTFSGDLTASQIEIDGGKIVIDTGGTTSTIESPVQPIFLESGGNVALVSGDGSIFLTLNNSTGSIEVGNSPTVNVGFFGSAGSNRPSITGSRGGNAAVASLLSGLSALGLIFDNTTA